MFRGGPSSVKVCCGPRCGTDPQHRAVYAAAEAACPDGVAPTLCRGLCGDGVTLVRADGTRTKVRDAAETCAELSQTTGGFDSHAHR